eukprot:CAMPEP_0202695714 /NCGR_PEP_ID=MMETSP1385-20130828/9246_1 /ASSEMBLY_ACC=CAM_ASM_000861 /TAXON_ID=933848 /ORGANISM="Elphidium margaritaceum" /LENGTH=661 /DNA_ID=CAMNT_0049351791 /DNA_START=14 /DNA_END=1999 /DNA_ORIENTATION=-
MEVTASEDNLYHAYDDSQSSPKRCCTRSRIILVSILLLIICAISGVVVYFVVFKPTLESTAQESSFDYIVVGSGPTGSIVSSRLAANGYTVLLLETGSSTQHSLNGTLRVLDDTTLTLFDIPLDWDVINLNQTYYDEYINSPTTYGNSCCVPETGRSVGGSGAMNAMIYMRGVATDFTAELGWIGAWTNYSNLLTYYMRSENNTDLQAASDAATHNTTGNVHIAYNREYASDTLSSVFLDTCKNTGYGITYDFNTESREHNICGYYQFLVEHGYDGIQHQYNHTIRDSVARAFFGNDEDRKPRLLTIRANAMAIDIVFDEVNTTQAVGVRYVDLAHGNKVHTVKAKREIVLSAGALQTPTILMQSGVGDADVLMSKFGFASSEIVLNNSQIGQNYIDGVFTYAQWRVNDELLQNFSLCTPWNATFFTDDRDLMHKQKECTQAWNNYTATNTSAQLASVFGSTGFNVGGFFKSPFSKDTKSMDLQLTLQPYDILLRYNESNILTAQIANNLPYSVGEISWHHLNSVDDLQNLVIDASNVEIKGNYVSHPNDLNSLVYGLNLTRNLLGTAPLKDYLIEELWPGTDIQSNEQLQQFVQESKDSADHIAGTCKLGAVVNEQLQVIGLENLRVADASIFPMLPSGNTHATCMMVGEYAAQMILDSA